MYLKDCATCSVHGHLCVCISAAALVRLDPSPLYFRARPLLRQLQVYRRRCTAAGDGLSTFFLGYCNLTSQVWEKCYVCSSRGNPTLHRWWYMANCLTCARHCGGPLTNPSPPLRRALEAKRAQSEKQDSGNAGVRPEQMFVSEFPPDKGKPPHFLTRDSFRGYLFESAAIGSASPKTPENLVCHGESGKRRKVRSPM